VARARDNVVAGITTVVSFSTDGVFVAPTQLPTGRKIEFIGDSITAATNVVRPEGAPHCGDGGYQSDWSQTYVLAPLAPVTHAVRAQCALGKGAALRGG
jgi:hypothetical protein